MSVFYFYFYFLENGSSSFLWDDKLLTVAPTLVRLSTGQSDLFVFLFFKGERGFFTVVPQCHT